MLLTRSSKESKNFQFCISKTYFERATIAQKERKNNVNPNKGTSFPEATVQPFCLYNRKILVEQAQWSEISQKDLKHLYNGRHFLAYMVHYNNRFLSHQTEILMLKTLYNKISI